MYIHEFGAYFGLIASYILTDKKKLSEAKKSHFTDISPTSNLLSLVGTIFLWMYWPSFNSALAGVII